MTKGIRPYALCQLQNHVVAMGVGEAERRRRRRRRRYEAEEALQREHHRGACAPTHSKIYNCIVRPRRGGDAHEHALYILDTPRQNTEYIYT